MLKVLESDPGIRPAGKSNECLYCKQKVGQTHKESCIIMVRTVVYEVLIRDEGELKFVGTWAHQEPASWTEKDMLFARNEGSWCADNLLGDKKLELDDEKTWKRALERIKGLTNECLCGDVELKPKAFGSKVYYSSDDGAVKDGEMFTILEAAKKA